ncbi:MULTISPECIES: hypothetical protein [Chryseobacterium]|uniref:Por secretion system C-terminal sorting domain-containing protein n=1 Tax=Chryseobacterium cucumeris TaxID=1813611 RepID=A0ABX9XBZ8_9FLAO|nr:MULTISPECIES: hypothetical protein [Chryseobacterium]TXI88498.1 MAG: hypothetical protein E6Q36_05425 [Chryseobacterium sp.]KYH07399.1 hypothetical protein A1704_01620 [Chryseobacterium cucumeris]RKE81295.1 hypothetical protein DEU39_0827 [Chryseobacterium sp. AG363]ROH94160.1 hypothetical protein EGI15_06625 [Chryseobacterium cucumeris]WFB68344.1 hypothetical protein PZ898_02815 [Chryseobacterium sp. WX]
MSTLLKAVFFAGALLFSANVMSKDRDFSLSFGNVQDKTLNFELSNAKSVSVFVYNTAHDELFSENLKDGDHVMKTYDFQNFTPGTYYLVAESEAKIEKYKIKINADNVMEVEKTPVSAVNKPEYTISGHMAKLHMSDVKGTVSISVYDLSNTTYYTSNKKYADGKVDITFDLDPKTADQYIIQVEENGNVFNKIISLR